MTLLKQDSTMDIFRGMFLLFRDIYLFNEPPNNHYFDKAPQGKLSLCNRRNTETALRTPAKSHKGLQDAESFAKSCPG